MPLFDSHITTLGLQTETRSAFDSPATPLTAIAAWDDLGGGPTASGESVSERTALAISTVYTCVTTLSEAVASLPCLLMRRLDKGRAPAVDSYLYDLLRFEPNPEMTAFTFWQTMVGCSALTGNGYAQIMRDPDGSVSGLWPLNPLKTEPFRQADGTLAFRTTDGAHEGTYRIIPSRDILHFPLFSLSGIKGVSPVTAARETFALTKAAEKYGARWFGNGAEASSVFIFKGAKPDPKVQAELTESWQTKHGGANRHRQAFLFGDWDVRTLGLSPEDSQFLSTRNFQRAEIAAMFHLQPHQVGDTSRLSNANHVQAQLSFVTDTLRPILVRIESELQRKLLPPPRTGSKLFVTFDVSERLRGDSQSQMTAYATGRQWGFLSINDCREGLGLNPIGNEGDVYLSPVNMSDAASLLQPAKHRTCYISAGRSGAEEEKEVAAITY